MQILIESFGSAGDVHPYVAVGRALLARGHSVALLTNERFGAVVTRAGLEFVEVGDAESFERTIRHPDLWHPRRGLRVILQEGVRRMLPVGLAALRERLTSDTVVIGSTLAFSARVLRELESVPLVTMHLAPMAFQSMERMPRFAGLPALDWAPRWLKRGFWWAINRMADAEVRPWFDTERRALGLPPARSIFGDWLHSPDRVIGLYPEWFAPPQSDYPEQVRLTGFPLFDEADQRPVDDELEAWIDAGDAPVVVTAGSVNLQGAKLYAACIEACGRIGRRLLVVSTARANLPERLPAHVRHVDYVPFSRVLPRAAALVSHGGIGTCAQALAAATPHLVTAHGFDQFDNASRLVRLDTGRCVAVGRASAARVERELRELVDSPAVRVSCQGVARLVDRRGALQRTCDLVEQVGAAANGRSS